MTTTAAPKLLTLGDVFDLLRRRPLWAACAALATMLAVLAFTSTTVPLYEAHARLAIDRGSKPVEWQVDPDTGKVEFGLLNTQKEMLLSHAVLGEAVKSEAFGEDPGYKDVSDRVARLSHRIKVTTNRDSWIIAVSLAAEEAPRAELQLKAVLDAFTRLQGEREVGSSRTALRFLNDQVGEAKRRLEESRAAEAAFRSEKGLISTDPDRNFIGEQISSMNARRAELSAQIAGEIALLEQIAVAEKQPDADAKLEALLRVEPIRTNPVVVEQQRALFAMAAARAPLAHKYGPKHPRLLEAEGQVAQQRKLLDQAVGMARDGIASDHLKLQMQERDVAEAVARKEKELGVYREHLAALQALTEQTTSRNGIYERLLTRQGEEEVSSRLNMPQVAVVDPPHAQPKPVNISRVKFLAIALLAGMAMAVAVPLLAEGLDTRVRGALAAQVLTRLPLLGKTPRVPRLAPLGRGGDPERPHALAEAFRNLRAALRLAKRPESGCCVLAVTSCRPYEGKSTVATRLAISLSSSGAKVLLVDADMRKPTLHTQIGEPAERGLSAMLEGEKGVHVQTTSYGTLDFLGVGARPRTPGDLLHSPQLREMVFTWRQSYDYVIFDTPPLAPVSDAVIVGEVADGIVLVVRDHFTTKANIRAALSRLAPLSHKILGVVLNGERGHEASYGYYARSARASAVGSTVAARQPATA